MSILIDKLTDVNTEIDSKWYIAKPLGKKSIFARIIDAYRIMTNKSIAVHFKEY